MPAPVPAATPHAPAGIRIENGHPTIITFANDPDISLWEIDVTPPGVDGGEANDLTNMHNDAWRTYAARTLKQLTEAGATVQVAPEAFTQVVAIVNDPTTVTIHMPGGATLAFFGYLRQWTPGTWVEGEPPTATCAIMPTNRDVTDDTEQAPVLTVPPALMRRIGRRFIPVGSPITSKGKTPKEVFEPKRIPKKVTPKVSVPRPSFSKKGKAAEETGEVVEAENKA